MGKRWELSLGDPVVRGLVLIEVSDELVQLEVHLGLGLLKGRCGDFPPSLLWITSTMTLTTYQTVTNPFDTAVEPIGDVVG